MRKQNNIRVLELLKYLYLRTDEEHPATIADMLDYLKGKGLQAVRQTVYGDLQDLIAVGIDVVVIKSTQNQYFIGTRLFEYPELKMLTDAVASSKVISADKTNELIQKLCRLTSESEAEKLQRLATISSRIKPHNEKVYYIIDGIQNAILESHQIQFQYYEYTPKKSGFSNMMAISIRWIPTLWNGKRSLLPDWIFQQASWNGALPSRSSGRGRNSGIHIHPSA